MDHAAQGLRGILQGGSGEMRTLRSAAGGTPRKTATTSGASSGLLKRPQSTGVQSAPSPPLKVVGGGSPKGTGASGSAKQWSPAEKSGSGGALRVAGSPGQVIPLDDDDLADF